MGLKIETIQFYGELTLIDNFQASIANNMLKSINSINKKHLIVADYYSEHLKALSRYPFIIKNW